ncbi:hypothetical protein M3J09_011463 [Ascochyta lentis]
MWKRLIINTTANFAHVDYSRPNDNVTQARQTADVRNLIRVWADARLAVAVSTPRICAVSRG